jgi:hypothetical protein
MDLKRLACFGLALFAFSLAGVAEGNAQKAERARLGKQLAECLAQETKRSMSEGWQLPHQFDQRLEKRCGFLEEKESQAFAQEVIDTFETEPSVERRAALITFMITARDRANPRRVAVFAYSKVFDDAFAKDKGAAPRPGTAPAR